MTHAALTDMGLDALRSLRTERGFDASDAQTGLYPALYGRDSLWVILLLIEALQIRHDERVAELLLESGPAVLGSLAALQGTTVDDRVEEQPGRIPHEFHQVRSVHAQEMALPLAGGRSYGGFDETFLFILAYDAFVRRHPRHVVADSLWPNVERAFRWIDEWADPDGDGFFEYLRRDPANLLNEVWKDSFDSATHTGFDVPPGPIAWLDVQAYAYGAFRVAERRLAERRDLQAAERCGRRAEALAALVNERFWLSEDSTFALALDGLKRPLRMVASNAGHALWAGIVGTNRVDALVGRLLMSDMFSAYGLRTLSTRSPFYAPFAYHRGAIWPFDNAVFALGLLRHDKRPEAARIGRAVGSALAKADTPVECYAVLEAESVIAPDVAEPVLCWHRWPVRNRVQALTAAALVVFGALEEAG